MNRCQLDYKITCTNIWKDDDELEELRDFRHSCVTEGEEMDQKEGGAQGGKGIVNTKEYQVFNAGITAVNGM